MSFMEFALKLFHLGEGPPDQSSRFAAIGRDLPRVDGRTKVIGTATYAAEWPVENVVHGAVVDTAIRGAEHSRPAHERTWRTWSWRDGERSAFLPPSATLSSMQGAIGSARFLTLPINSRGLPS